MGILYDDKLHKFDGLNPRFLESNHQEDLQFEVTFPHELGNEFQGLGFEFELRFIIKGNAQTPTVNPDSNPEGSLKPSHPITVNQLASPPTEGQILPSTSTNMYNSMLIGAILIVSGGGLAILQKRRKRHE